MVQWLLVICGALLLLYALGVLVLVVLGRRSDARALAGFIPDCLVLFKRLVADPRVGRRRKGLLLGTIAYLAMPFDLVPDFIPVAGQLDDAIILAVALRVLLRGSGTGVLEEHWPGPEQSLRVMLRLAGGGRKRPGAAS